MGFSAASDPTTPSAPTRRRRGQAHGELVVGYAGTIGITNALEVLFEAARQLRDEPGIRFRVVGDGSLLSQFKERVRPPRRT